MMPKTLIAAATVLCTAGVTGAHFGEHTSAASESENAPTVKPAVYRGWNTQCLTNNLVAVHVVPEIGGRVVQFQLGQAEFFWVNPDLAGTLSPASGLAADGGWLNYGGDKLWPAPQGWDTPEQWPGPPDAVLDGQPHRLEILPASAVEAAVKLTSREDHRSGIQFPGSFGFSGTTPGSKCGHR